MPVYAMLAHSRRNLVLKKRSAQVESIDDVIVRRVWQTTCQEGVANEQSGGHGR